MKALRVSLCALGLTMLIGGAAQAQSPKIRLTGPGEVVEGNKAVFVVDVQFDYPLVDCLPNDPDCNTKTVQVCVDYRTIAGTAHDPDDLQGKSGRLSQTLVFNGPDEAVVGSIEIPTVADTLTESPETFKVQLSLPTQTGAGACTNQAALQVFTAEATIVDSPPPPPSKPDLKITQIRLLHGCQIEMTIANAGQGTLPDSAYHPTNGAAIQLTRNRQPWGGLRLAGVDPTKKLKTPGASIKHVWFPGAANLKLPDGAHTLFGQIDRFNVVAESDETNNSLTSRVICRH